MKGKKLKSKGLVILILVAFLFIMTHYNIFFHSTNDLKSANAQTISEGDKIKVATMGWTLTEVMLNESSVAQWPRLVIDSAGNIHLAWFDQGDYMGSGTEPDIFYRLWNSSSRMWTTVEVVSLEHTGDSTTPAITVDVMGQVHLIWADNTDYNGSGGDRDIFYKRRNPNTGIWTPTVVVSDICDKTSMSPEIVVDSQGNLYAVWMDGTDYDGAGSTDWDIFYRSWNATTDSWATTQVISVNSTALSQNPAVAVDSNGTVHIVWQEETSPNRDNILYRWYNTSSKMWSSTELVSTESTEDTKDPEIVVDGMGHLHLIWSELSVGDDDIYYKRRNSTTGNWTTTELVSAESGGHSSQPSLTVDGLGNLHAVWADLTYFPGAGSDKDIFYQCWNATTYNWSSLELISTESTGVSAKSTIAVDGTGNIHIAWEDATVRGGTDFDIVYKKSMWLPKGPVLAPIFPNPNTDGTVALNWSAVANTTTYYIYRDVIPFTTVGSRTPIGSTSQTNYTNLGLLSGTYYYTVGASNGTHNSSLSNCESVLVQLPDTQAPQYTNAIEGRPSPQNYTADQVYQFNLTITDDMGLGTVFFEWNGTNYTAGTHAGDEYYYELSDLGAGTYQYRWLVNDTSDNWNATLLVPYLVTKATPDLDLLLNGTPADYQINATWICNVTVIFSGNEIVYLYLNKSLMDSGAAPLENISQFNQLGVYNVTAWYPGGANYSTVKLTRWLTVVDGLPPGPCSINITIPYTPNFILEASAFTLWGGTDVGSGISAYQYQIDTGSWIIGTNFSLAGWPNGLHTIAYRAVDAWGNNGTVQNCTVYLLANNADYDQDGLTNEAELTQYGTDLFNSDTDGDGILDGVEVAQGSNPLDPNSPLLERVLLICLIVGGVVGTGTILLLIRMRKHTPSSKAGGRKKYMAKGN